MTYEELISELDELTRTYNAFAVSIDGMTGAGKTTLAAHLSKRYGAPVIHMDDFRLPLSERKAAIPGQYGSDMDFERFEEEISEPWRKKKPIVYSILDEKTGEILERAALPDGQMYLIEGTFATHPALTDFYDFRIFMKVSEEEQRRRVPTLSPERIQEENDCFDAYMIEALADAVLDETFTLPET